MVLLCDFECAQSLLKCLLSLPSGLVLRTFLVVKLCWFQKKFRSIPIPTRFSKSESLYLPRVNPVWLRVGKYAPPLWENCAKNQQNVQKAETNDWLTTQSRVKSKNYRKRHYALCLSLTSETHLRLCLKNWKSSKSKTL